MSVQERLGGNLAEALAGQEVAAGIAEKTAGLLPPFGPASRISPPFCPACPCQARLNAMRPNGVAFHPRGKLFNRSGGRSPPWRIDR